jgi:hypothetical protein
MVDLLEGKSFWEWWNSYRGLTRGGLAMVPKLTQYNKKGRVVGEVVIVKCKCLQALEEGVGNFE